MRRTALIPLLALSLSTPALAQTAAPGSLPPPVPATPSTAPEPGLGERAGAAIDRGLQATGRAATEAARATGEATREAGERAGRWTGTTLERVGGWTQRQGQRLRGEPEPGAAPAPPPVTTDPLPPPVPRN